MNTISTFLEHFDLTQLISLLIQAIAALLCISFHEMGHGFAAWCLGDETAKRQGRVSMNPLHHIDPLGLILLVTAGFGWAKPVPVDMRHFRHPKSGMAITALAGPLSNFLMGWAALGGASLLYHFALKQIITVQLYAHLFALLIQIAVLSVGLGMFNLIPFPPLDGSKILFSLLPDRIYYFILRLRALPDGRPLRAGLLWPAGHAAGCAAELGVEGAVSADPVPGGLLRAVNGTGRTCLPPGRGGTEPVGTGEL